ncbi:MAG: TonB-dependent receptor plug domain-containing protein [Bacteroidales bacterium]
MRNIPVPTVELALQGKSAGVFIESVNGKSSGTTRMRIRGSSSIGAINQPLFVVDGIPLTTEALNYSGGDINPLTSINFNDIESVEILKDAASAAIYGSRGANGVVLITTKKGVEGDTRLNFNFQVGVSEESNRREFLNTAQYIELFEEAAYNSDLLEGYDPINNPGDYPGSWLEYTRGRFTRYSGYSDWTIQQTETDWQDQIFRKGKLLSTDLSAQGGNDKLKYFASAAYTKQEGILRPNDIEKISARLNVDNKVNKFTDFGFALSLNRTFINNVSDDNAFSTPMQLVAMAPITPVRDLDGNLYDRPVTTYYNGLIDFEDTKREVVEYRTVANSYLNFQLYEGLKLRNEVGFDLYNLKENARYGEKTDAGQGINGYGFGNYAQTQNIATKSYLDYMRNTDAISISAVLGTEFMYTTVDLLRAEGEQFPREMISRLWQVQGLLHQPHRHSPVQFPFLLLEGESGLRK